jgi:hypothetical protein
MPRRATFVARYLDPLDRLSEFLFGLIMVLSFTLGASLIIDEGEQATRQMLLAIIGGNIAWGLIDGAMYIINSLCERSGKARLLESLQQADDGQDTLALVGGVLDERLEPYTSAEERKELYSEIVQRLRNVSPQRTRLTRNDLGGALACFTLVLSTTVPAILPFLVIDDRYVALRFSNLLLVGLLFLTGWHWARATHSNPWVFGTSFLAAGLGMVFIAMAFGG